METETGVIIPPGVRGIDVDPTDTGETHVLIDNRTDLPDGMVQNAVQEHFVENASLAWGHTSTFQTYANEGGSLLARTKFTVPKDVWSEISLCRDIAERDDDVRSALRSMIAVAYEGGMQNFHEDERTVRLFNEMAREANFDHLFEEIYREYMISQQVTTITAFTRERLDWTPNGTSEPQEERVVVPHTTVLPAESIRVLEPGLFGEGGLGYIPERKVLREWLEEFFADGTTPARKAAMAREDPVAATLFIERVRSEERDDTALGSWTYAYRLNPRMADRFTAPKGSNPYPRPLLTANFALIEAKRLLNLMDYALLQGGANYIVIAKKGNDQFRATQPELENLQRVVARASKTGVIVGDHRLNIEVVTPELKELLNAEKRQLLGRKLANLMLGVPEPPDGAGAESMKAWMELVTRVISADRHKVKRHVERAVYAETAKRNRRVFPKGAAKVWHPKIILQGAQFFTDMVLKLGDRGNISRKTLTEVAGFSWEAEVSQRKAELEAGIDEVMIPGQIPFDSPNGGPPSDNPDGRPSGSGPNNGRPGARVGPGPDPAAPRRLLRGPGEPVRAWWDDDLQTTIRVGEITYGLLEQYPDREEGRFTQFERAAYDGGDQASNGTVTLIPVNHAHDCKAERMVRLAPGLSIVLGYRRHDEALVTKAFVLRSPEFTEVAAEELVLKLGFDRAEETEEETAVVRTRKLITRLPDGGYEVIEEPLDVDA